MASIHRHPRSPFWMAHFYKGGVRTTKSTRVPSTDEERERAQGIADAWEKAASMAGEGRDGREWMAATLNELFGEQGLPSLEPAVESWEALAARWLATTSGRRKVATSTAYIYRQVVASFSSYLGAKARQDAALITPKEVDGWVDALGRRITAGTVRVRLNILRGVFGWAVKQGALRSNPATAVEMPQTDAQEREPFTAEDVAKMMARARQEAADGAHDAAERVTMILLGLCTGARIGDCVGMRWTSIDLEAERISYVPRKKSRAGHAVNVQLVDPLLSHLRELPRKGQFVCPRLAAKTIGRIGADFTEFLARAGVTGKTITAGRARAFHTKTFHSLRHTLATLLAEAGVDDLVRRRITDHQDKKVAAIYQHVTVEATGRALNKVLAGFQSPDPALLDNTGTP